MNLTEVTTKIHVRQFLDVPKHLYKNDPNWVCLLDIEIENIFSPQHNNSFKQGEAKRWILTDDNGMLMGRIAAFYNTVKASKHEQPTGGIGFFECINSHQAAHLLFDTAKNWLQSKGMEAMDGPINFGENITHWGLLIDGFIQQGYGMPYNFPYYKTLFEEYGFKEYFQQFTYDKKINTPLPERQVKFAEFIIGKPEYRFDHFRFSNKEKYLRDIVYIFNEVWKDFHEDYTPLAYNDIDQMLTDAKDIINEELILFAYEGDEPMAMIVVFPDINQILKKLGNGKLTLLNKLKFLYHKKTGTITRARQLLTGVVPKYQKSGITGALFLKMMQACKKNNIQELEMGWIGDYNISVNKIYKLMDLPVAKTHATYRYLFDQNKPFTRFTNAHSEKMKRTLHREEN